MVFDEAMVTCYSRFRFQSGLWFAGLQGLELRGYLDPPMAL